MARKILEVKKSIQRICDQHILGLVLTRTKSTLVWISCTHNLCIQSHINCAPSIVCLRLYGVSDMTNLLIADRTGDWSCRHLIVISAVWVPWGDIWQGYWWQPATLGCCQVFDSLQGEIERERERVLFCPVSWLGLHDVSASESLLLDPVEIPVSFYVLNRLTIFVCIQCSMDGKLCILLAVEIEHVVGVSSWWMHK